MTDSRRGRPRSASLPYVPLDPHIETHPRTMALIDALDDETSLPATLIPTIVVRLLCHAGAQAIDGNIGHMSDGVLRRRFAPEFGFSPGRLRAALTDPDCGFLVETEDGLLIHDWADGGGQLLAKRNAWREKKSKKSEGLIFSENSPRTLELSRPKGKGKGKGKNRQATDIETASRPPTPEPEPTPAMPAGQDICPSGQGKALDELPDHEPLSGAAVEAAMARAGLLASVGAGASGSLGKLVALCPIHAWELRTALPQCAGKRSPAGYAAGIIRALRSEGRAPPPKAADAETHRGPVSAVRLPTVAEREATHSQAWVRAIAAASMPPASPERLAHLVTTGEPGPDDHRAMLAAGGSWQRYDEQTAAAKAEAQATLAALVGGLAM